MRKSHTKRMQLISMKSRNEISLGSKSMKAHTEISWNLIKTWNPTSISRIGPKSMTSHKQIMLQKAWTLVRKSHTKIMYPKACYLIRKSHTGSRIAWKSHTGSRIGSLLRKIRGTKHEVAQGLGKKRRLSSFRFHARKIDERTLIKIPWPA